MCPVRSAAQELNEAAEKEGEHEMEGGRREGGQMALGFFLFSNDCRDRKKRSTVLSMEG